MVAKSLGDGGAAGPPEREKRKSTVAPEQRKRGRGAGETVFHAQETREEETQGRG